MPPESLKLPSRPEASSSRSRLLILIAMVLCTVRMLESPPMQSANDRSRWVTVWSLVERGTYQIDEIIQSPGWDTIDKVRFKDHFYSSKPPLMSTVVAGMSWGIKHTLGWTMDAENPASVTPISQLILFLINIVPTAFALECIARLAWRYSEHSFTRGFILATACFGTLWCAYLPSLNNHTPAICCVVFALRASIVAVPSQLGWSRAAVAGFFAALAVTFELPALAFFVGLFVIVIKLAPREAILAFIPAAMIPAAAHFGTNYLVTADWKPFYASFDAPGVYKYEYDGVPSYWKEPKGLDKPGKEDAYAYAFHCTLGHHGLLSLTPVFVLSIIGFIRIKRWQNSPLAAYFLLGALLTVVVLGYYISQTEHRNYGGVSVGLRWMLWLIPFWLMMMMPAVDLISAILPGRALLAGMFAASMFSAWHPFDGPWRQPWIYELLGAKHRLNPEYFDPAPKFSSPRRSWLACVPTDETLQEDYWVELAGAGADGSPITLKISDGGRVELLKSGGRRIRFLWNAGQPNERLVMAVVDADRLNGGKVGDLIDWQGAELDAIVAQEIRTLVFGLPEETKYDCTGVRYTKLPLRTDAFKCEVGYGSLRKSTGSPATGDVFVSSEFYSTPELPFGIAMWRLQTTGIDKDDRLTDTLSDRVLTVTRAGRMLAKPKAVGAEAK